MSRRPLENTALVLSRIFHPLNIIIVTALLLNSHVHQSFILGARDLFILVLCLTPGLGYFAHSKRAGQEIQYAQVVFPFLLLGLGTTFVIYTLLANPPTILQGVTVALFVGIGATLIEKWWDMSNHAWVPMSCAALWLPFSITNTLLLVGVGFIAGLVRLPLKEHTPFQVLGGWLYGFTATYLLVILLIR